MEATNHVNCACQFCDKQIEFEILRAGETVACPHCGLETTLFIPQATATQNPIAATGKKNKIRWSLILLVCLPICGVVGFGLYRLHQRQVADKSFYNLEASIYETGSQRIEKFHAQAPEALLERCTNDVVGLTKIIFSTVDDTDPDPNKWTGYAEVEHLNSVGGIERQKLWFIFEVEWLLHPKNGAPVLPSSNYLLCLQDPKKELEQLNSK